MVVRKLLLDPEKDLRDMRSRGWVRGSSSSGSSSMYWRKELALGSVTEREARSVFLERGVGNTSSGGGRN